MRAKEKHSLSLSIKNAAQHLGFSLVGISPVRLPPHEQSFARWLRAGYAGELGYMQRTELLRRDPHELVPWAVSVVSVGMNYYVPLSRPNPAGENCGWISRYAWGDDYHELMMSRLDRLLRQVSDLNGSEVQGRAFVDAGPVLERDIAGVAGLGWIGKNTQLISPKKGSWFFLGELFLDVELDYDKPIRDRCGRCDLCLKACPTEAFVGPYVLDARRCISYLTIELKGYIPRHLRPLIGNHIFGCDICQDVCPYNVKAEPTDESAYTPRVGLHAPDLIELLSLTDEEFRQRFARSPIRRAKRRGLLRNVAVALGNIGNTVVVEPLARALNDSEPLIRGHVAWALGRIGTAAASTALQDRLSIETDLQVREEIAAALSELVAARSPAAAGN